MLQRIRIEGPARERGRQYGSAARERIDAGIDLYAGWFRDFAQLGWAEVGKLSRPYWEHLRASHPERAEELRGIAEGAGRLIEDIVALNARTEIAYAAQKTSAPPSECTSLGVRPAASADGHVYIAENWDWLTAALDNTVLLHVVQPDGLELLTVTEAGMLAKFGVNSAGVALCNNLLATDHRQVGALFHTLSRDVLSSRTLMSAMWSVTGATRAGSGNYLLGSADDEDLVDLEWAPGDFNAIFPDDAGLITHSNHFTTRLPGQRDRTTFLPTVSPGSHFRLRRAKELLAQAVADGGVRLVDLQALLCDHRYAPESICRHPGQVDGRPILGQSNVSFIVDLTAQTFSWTAGPPCESDYVTEPLPWALAADASLATSPGTVTVA